jgi:hypothetical protein
MEPGSCVHVVQNAEEWKQPVKIHNHDLTRAAFLREELRVIISGSSNDSAAILFPRSELEFPDALIPLRPIDTPIPVGAEVGWLGFPAIASYTLCFFAGPVSARWDFI